MILPITTHKYLVLSGRLQHPDTVGDLKELQTRLNNVLKRINKGYSLGMVSKLTLVEDSGFLGVLQPDSYILTLLEQLQRAMEPDIYFFGLGLGTIATQINTETPIGADGPAFSRCQDALNRLAFLRKHKPSSPAILRIVAEQSLFIQAEALNALFEVMAALRDEWQPRQSQIAWDMLLHRDGQTACAKRLGVNQSTIARSLAGSNFYVYQKAMEAAELAIRDLADL
ncbi:MAG: SatD family protein [Erysipelotrichaceae bacterium]|jgi:hypothetical protein|nr:SatD family protein [Erysipelotrichaceae bacterium]